MHKPQIFQGVESLNGFLARIHEYNVLDISWGQDYSPFLQNLQEKTAPVKIKGAPITRSLFVFQFARYAFTRLWIFYPVLWNLTSFYAAWLPESLSRNLGISPYTVVLMNSMNCSMAMFGWRICVSNSPDNTIRTSSDWTTLLTSSCNLFPDLVAVIFTPNDYSAFHLFVLKALVSFFILSLRRAHLGQTHSGLWISSSSAQ